MEDWQARTRALLGNAAMQRLSDATVAVIGLGGVGGACAEALVRAGIGRLILVDHDTVDATNCNRQLFATRHTIGMRKVDAALSRLRSISEDTELVPLDLFYDAAHRDALFALSPDLIADAIDSVTSKLDLAVACKERGIPLIECLGTGNRLDPSAFRIGTIEDTAGCGCGLARVMRRELKKRGVEHQPVVYSLEVPRQIAVSDENGRHPPASSSVCPPAAGYLMASWILRKIIE